MTPRDWFGVFVRVLSVWVLVLASEYALGSLDRMTTSRGTLLVPDERHAADIGPKGYVLFSLGYGALGFYLLAKADSVVNLAYGRSSVEDPRQDDHDAS